ncbi:MAG: transposase [Neisseriaceae bacterium]|nr:transposase [Neisseriaceae bacterium]
METGFCFRCYPTLPQQKLLLQWIGCQRFIYNAKVNEDRYFRTFAKKSLALTGQFAPIDQKYSHFKTELTPWLKEVPSHILRNGAFLWKQAYSRFFNQLGGRPKIKRKSGRQSVYITGELFNFIANTDENTGEVTYQLTLGNKKFPIGVLAYVAHRPHYIPKSITISVIAGKWYLSFCNVDEQISIKPEEIAEELKQWSKEELTNVTIGIDRGVVKPICCSTSHDFDILPKQIKRIDKKERLRIRWQRKMARRHKGSSGWKKAQIRIAKTYEYAREVRKDFAHKVSYALSNDPCVRLVVFEDLKINNMTKKPKPKQDQSGKYIRNGAQRKAGLNKSILASMWGKIHTWTKYKALRNNKLVIEVSAHYSSQACSHCGYTASDNRRSQSEFVCQSCGFAINADVNASRVIAKRGVEMILSGTYQAKAKKRIKKEKQVGAVYSEPLPVMVTTPNEIGKPQFGIDPNCAIVVDFGNPLYKP